MTDAEIAALVTRCLYEVAPEIEGEEIAPDEPLADQFELELDGSAQSCHRASQGHRS